MHTIEVGTTARQKPNLDGERGYPLLVRTIKGARHTRVISPKYPYSALDS